MRYTHRQHANLLAATLLGLLLMGCGRGQNNGALPPGGIGAPLPPGGGIGGGACMPIIAGNAPVPVTFFGQGVMMSTAQIAGGLAPSGQMIGQIFVQGAGGVAGGQLSRQGSDGTISMSVTMGNVMQQPWPTQGGVSVQGTLQLSQLAANDLMFKFQRGALPMGAGGMGMPGMPGMPGFPGGGFPQPGIGMQNICVSHIGMQLGYYGTTIYGGQVWLYVNGSNMYYTMYF